MAESDAEFEVDDALARALIADHFPTLDATSLRRVGEGWDNVVWATPDPVAFRFPRRPAALAGVQREMELLPALAPRLPLAIPDAAHPGPPDPRFPWPWFGSTFIPGRELPAARLDDTQRTALAPQLGRFLRALHDVPLDGPFASLPVDPVHRSDMALRVPRTREALAAVAPLWHAPAASRSGDLLEEAAHLPPSSDLRLVHGDLHVRHLLLDDACALTGVIDWGDVCRSHPSMDLALVWSLLPPAGRDAFLAVYGPVDPDGLLRARVLSLFFSATLAAYGHANDMRDLTREALAGLDRTLVT